jgi:hypothetical protein
MTNINEIIYVCDYPECNYSSTNKNNFYKHKKIHSNDVFKCIHQNCDYKTNVKSNLVKHVKTHLTVKNYDCDYLKCLCKFKTLNELNKHKKIHQNIEYKCSNIDCSYSTNVIAYLKQHEKIHYKIVLNAEWINDEIKNKYNNSPFRIPLRNNNGIIVEYALVDKEDFERVNKYKWSLNANGYAQGTVEGKSIRLHHFVFKKPGRKNVIDHINQDKLNNTKLNLREVSYSENNHNQIKNINVESTSRFKGVHWDKKSQKWRSECNYNKKYYYLGNFDTEEKAAKQYDIFTFKKYKEKANNNNLVKYEDTLDINIDDIIIKRSNIYDMPKNIVFSKTENNYRAVKNYNKKTYRGVYRKTVDEALEDLKNINLKITFIKVLEELLYFTTTPITKNNDGIAFIKVKDIEVLVDENLWYKFNKIFWYITNTGYIGNKDGLMHRRVIKAKEDDLVDHINNKKYDNRENNLRIASASLNAHNRSKSKNASSKYFGVSFKSGKWRSRITCKGISYYLGKFSNEEEAAKAYNIKALELYGENVNVVL